MAAVGVVGRGGCDGWRDSICPTFSLFFRTSVIRGDNYIFYLNGQIQSSSLRKPTLLTKRTQTKAEAKIQPSLTNNGTSRR